MTCEHMLAIPAYPRNTDAGGQPLGALHACLSGMQVRASYSELAVLSGAAFQFVYDNAPVFEPLRELSPVNLFRIAAQAYGLRGRWIVDQALDETLAQIRKTLEGGAPVVVPYYGNRHHFAVVVGLAGDLLIIHDPGEEEPAREEIVEWNGPVPGPLGWAANPAFIVERRALPGWDERGRVARSLERALVLLAGGSLPYRDHHGLADYTAVPLAGRHAAFGLPAYELLKADLLGMEHLQGFDMVWRADAQLGLLSTMRRQLANWLQETFPDRTSEIECAERVSVLAARLQSWFWCKKTLEFTSPGDIDDFIEKQPGFVFAVGLEPEHHEGMSTTVARTPWGHAAFKDSTARRRAAASLVKEMMACDKFLLRTGLPEIREELES